MLGCMKAWQIALTAVLAAASWAVFIVPIVVLT